MLTDIAVVEAVLHIQIGRNALKRKAWHAHILAMVELWQILPEQQWLHEQSRLYLDALLTPELSETGRFVGHRYKVAPGQSELVESACASFFLLEALLAHLA